MSEPANGKPLVLAADDDEIILGLVVYRLEHSGYRVITARDGEEALRLALAERPAIAVIDVMMPKLDGYELTRLLRAHDETRELPVILLTARSQEADVERGFAAGADDYLRKPFSPTSCARACRSLLAGARRCSRARARGRGPRVRHRLCSPSCSPGAGSCGEAPAPAPGGGRAGPRARGRLRDRSVRRGLGVARRRASSPAARGLSRASVGRVERADRRVLRGRGAFAAGS